MSSRNAEASIRELFRELTKLEDGKSLEAHDFQVQAARRLLEGENLVLVSPTGSGKSWAALLAFIYAKRHSIPFADRLIYAFPLRTLTTALYQQYGKYLEKENLKATLQIGGMERGEGDPFFDQGDVIFTTIDQLLSSYIGVPVSLPRRLANMPAGALVGSCVVFDEFHLMEPDKALATALDFAHRLKPYAQTLFMSATFSGEGMKEIQSRASAGVREVSPKELDRHDRSETRRTFVWSGQEPTAEVILNAHRNRSIIVLNTVDRATTLYRELVSLGEERNIDARMLLLHARFLPEHRKAKEAEILDLFAEKSEERAILVATQVVEVGLDISADVLHTEVAPASAVFQRAGRCARFGGEGTVYVHDLPEKTGGGRNAAPYIGETQAPLVDSTAKELESRSGTVMGFDEEREVLNEVHAEADLKNLKSVNPRRRRREVNEALGEGSGAFVRRLVREVDAVNLVVHRKPGQLRMELPLPSVSVSRSVARGYLTELKKQGQMSRASVLSLVENREESENYAPSSEWKSVEEVKDLNQSFYICVPPELAAYDSHEGLVLGKPGKYTFEQSIEEVAYEPYSYRKESWRDHTRRVMERYEEQKARHHIGAVRLAEAIETNEQTVERMGLLVAALHDLGKLAVEWQDRMWLWQQNVKPGESRDGFLGHSDFDGSDRKQREEIKQAKYKKPPHAVESYYAALRILQNSLTEWPDEVRKNVIVALGSAIARHHSAFASSLQEFRLAPGHEIEIEKVLERFGLVAEIKDQPKLSTRGAFNQGWFINPDTHDDVFSLYRYMVRRLRLADQKSNDW